MRGSWSKVWAGESAIPKAKGEDLPEPVPDPKAVLSRKADIHCADCRQDKPVSTMIRYTR